MNARSMDRFWAKVDATGECWVWTAAQRCGGYGVFQLDGKSQLAHRVAYRYLVGPIPEGLTLDHLCRNPSCVNPAHLEPVTLSENVRRGGNSIKTRCVRGHEFDEANTYLTPDGKRQCRACQSLRDAERGKTRQVPAEEVAEYRSTRRHYRNRRLAVK